MHGDTPVPRFAAARNPSTAVRQANLLNQEGGREVHFSEIDASVQPSRCVADGSW